MSARRHVGTVAVTQGQGQGQCQGQCQGQWQGQTDPDTQTRRHTQTHAGTRRHNARPRHAVPRTGLVASRTSRTSGVGERSEPRLGVCLASPCSRRRAVNVSGGIVLDFASPPTRTMHPRGRTCRCAGGFELTDPPLGRDRTRGFTARTPAPHRPPAFLLPVHRVGLERQGEPSIK